ncbi:Chimeric ERCC6-PGBD3 protein [Eumeta japonica]|uniref:Chimeric ERCC6-PGBD3 protein n=1 Tax=Eumeta variegata TaxID=151549 RepID=A0A4C1VU18_EUMVA|nr:Chimeric ERCC6-PGBD3 protein [Eumeta japonica]
MKPDDIKAILRMLENGEISEDEASENEDDIDYYSSQGELQIELEDDENLEVEPNAEPNLELDLLPTPTSSSEIQNEETAQQSIPMNSRDVLWKVKNMDIVQKAFDFEGNRECSQEILTLDTTFRFFSHFFAESITRYDKKIKRNIQVPCPRVIKEYNAYMGGVDLMDSFIWRYHIRIKSRKWRMRLFYHLLDITIINSWVLDKNVNVKRGTPQKDILKLDDFRTELADTLCQYQKRPDNKRGRPSASRKDDDVEPPSKTSRSGVQSDPLLLKPLQQMNAPICRNRFFSYFTNGRDNVDITRKRRISSSGFNADTHKECFDPFRTNLWNQ